MRIMNIIKLAKKLNLSITTVSRALGGYSDVSEATRKRVMDFAKKHNYNPTHMHVIWLLINLMLLVS